MKKSLVICLMCIFVMATLAGCKDAGSPQSDANATKMTSGAQAEASAEVTKKPENTGGITLDAIRKAAEDSGYNIYGEHQLVFLSEVKDGFSVEITADSHTTVYSFVECETEDAAAKNAKAIDDAGYNFAICKGRYLSCYAVDKKDGVIKDILSSLMDGKPVDKTLYNSPPAEQDLEQSSEAADPASSEQSEPATPGPESSEKPVSGDITGTWVSGTISGRYIAESGKFDEISGMGLIYVFREDGTFAQLIVYGSYIVTTGNYSVNDGMIMLTDRVSVESGDSGQTWSEQEVLPDASSHYMVETEDSGKRLLLGQEGANPPLQASVNAMKFSFKE